MNRYQSPSKEHYVTLLWRLDLSLSPGFPVVAGQWWRRPNGKVQAWYQNQDELALCMALARELVSEEPDSAEARRWTDYNGLE